MILRSRGAGRRGPVLSCAAALACCLPLVAQERRSVPTAVERAAVQSLLLDKLAASTADPTFASAAPDRLVAMAQDRDLSPALRYELLLHAERCARAAVDVAAGMRVAVATYRAFDVPTAEDAFLERLEADGRASPQQLAAGWLTILERWSWLLAGAPKILDAKFRAAQRVVARDVPPGLQAWVAQQCEGIRQMATLPVEGSPYRLSGPDIPALRRAAYYRGEWEAFTPYCDDRRVADILRASADARTSADLVTLAQAGERWLGLAANEEHATAARHLRRHAIDFLLPFSRAKPVDDAQRLEIERVRRLVEQTSALAVEPVLGELRFTEPQHLAQMLITGGEWAIAENELRGKSLGPDVATRATTRFAWRKIDAVTIRGGIRSGDGLNFRLAVGPVNVLLNWEGADQDLAYFGDVQLPPHVPRALVQGREHTIVVRQCGRDAVVAVDGRELFSAPAQLSGTITVYPAIGSEIFVKSIDVVGDPDVGKVVTGTGVTR